VPCCWVVLSPISEESETKSPIPQESETQVVREVQDATSTLVNSPGDRWANVVNCIIERMIEKEHLLVAEEQHNYDGSSQRNPQHVHHQTCNHCQDQK